MEHNDKNAATFSLVTMFVFDVDSMVVSWWIVAFLPSASEIVVSGHHSNAVPSNQHQMRAFHGNYVVFACNALVTVSLLMD